MLLVQFLSVRLLQRLRGTDQGYLPLPALKIDIEHGGGEGEKSHMLVAISQKSIFNPVIHHTADRSHLKTVLPLHPRFLNAYLLTSSHAVPLLAHLQDTVRFPV